MRLSEAEYRQFEEIFHGPDGGQIVKFLCGLSVGKTCGDFPERLKSIAASMNWLSESGALTDMGHMVAASCREYLFWQERDGKLPFAHAIPWLDDTYFKGRTIAEIGCGAGANLMALKGAARVVGIEPVEIYKQLGDLLRSKDNLPNPEILQSNGEALPFEDQSVDVVLSVASHQYFDIVRVFSEIARVLKPGGEVMIVGKSLSDHLRSISPPPMRANALKKEALCLANTLWYSVTERRLFPVRGNNTSRPIYPTCARMQRWMSAAGIEPDLGAIPVGSHCFLRGVKRGDVVIEVPEKLRERELLQA